MMKEGSFGVDYEPKLPDYLSVLQTDMVGPVGMPPVNPVYRNPSFPDHSMPYPEGLLLSVLISFLAFRQRYVIEYRLGERVFPELLSISTRLFLRQKNNLTLNGCFV